ncbi:MAG: ACP S-malonyltransferase [Pseudomonadota bacterium]|nr:ACP S-malonyltransferase [Pseudomonadota bacterium]
MKTAFVFSGQGSQSVGMGKALYHNFRAAKDVFDEVDDALNMHLSQMMFDGDIKDLTKTQNAQPAIMAVGVGVFKTLEQELGSPLHEKASYMAGHSLGEYTALCAAGSLTVRDTAKLLFMRGWAMAWASSIIFGGMAAVLGLSFEQVSTLVKEVFLPDKQIFIANDNCPGQIIVSGDKEAIEILKEKAEKMGAKKVIPLAVSGAFHSPYMKPAADEMVGLLREITLLTPAVPVISNVTAAPEVNPERIRKNLLNQITYPVLWRESVEFMLKQGTDTFIECANGKVMAGLIKRIAENTVILSAGDVDSIQSVLNLLR